MTASRTPEISGPGAPGAAPAMIGRAPAFLRALDLAFRFATTSLPVLLVGETGTGKELFAQAMHAWSGRRGPLVDLNCAALPRELVEGELFGHRRGAYTGADDAEGLIAASDGGTLLLDELPSLALEAQAKLLRVLEQGEVRRLGETGKRRVDLRIVAAAQGPLTREIEAGRFRADLYHRICGALVRLPPLRERTEDLLPLAEHFARRQGWSLGEGVASVLAGYAWPGNVRELRYVVERAGWLGGGGQITGAGLAEAIEMGCRDLDPRVPGRVGTVDAQLVAICAAHGWNAKRIMAVLGISRTTLYSRLRTHGLSLREAKHANEMFRNVRKCSEQS